MLTNEGHYLDGIYPRNVFQLNGGFVFLNILQRGKEPVVDVKDKVKVSPNEEVKPHVILSVVTNDFL